MLIIAVFLVSSQATSQETKTNCYCIKPDNDTSSSECYSLSNVISNSSMVHNDSCFCFKTGEYSLKNVWKIMSNYTLSNLSLVASCVEVAKYKPSANVTCCDNKSGLVVKNVSGLKIMGLNFTNCGQIFSFSKVENISSSLLLIYVENLTMSGVEVHDPKGWGIYCYSLLGNSHINYTLISGGHAIANHSGGNLRLKYYGDYTNKNETHNITISNSNIRNGTANSRDSQAYAGGIDIYLITRNRINLSFCNVTVHNNSGYDGGNVAVTYSTLGNGWNSRIIFSNCTISEGYAAHDGGGMFMEAIQKNFSSQDREEHDPVVIVRIRETKFYGNKAKSSGAGLYLQIHESGHLYTAAKIHIVSCNFSNNTAESSQSGTAVHVVNYNLPGSVKHKVPQYYVLFNECTFVNNGEDKDGEHLLGCGTMYIAENGMTVIKNSNFLNNICSGIVAVQSTVVMNGSVSIKNNSGYNGGGIMLCANSEIFLATEANVIIENNSASNFGGGIYAEFECSQAVPPCFYGTKKNSTQVYLVNNNASRAGDALYGGSVDDCYTSPNSFLLDGKHRVKFDTLFQINQSYLTNSLVTSDPYKVCFCINSNYDQRNCTTKYKYNDTLLYAGMEITVRVVLAGQRNGTVPGMVIASFNGSKNTSQKPHSVNLIDECTELKYDIISPYESDEKYNDDLFLSVENAYFRTRSPNQRFHSTVELTVNPCPRGFSLLGNKCTCSNLLSDNLKTIECDIQHQTAIRGANMDWWLGLDNGSIIFSEHCPFDFCQNQRKVTLSLQNESGHYEQCAFHRTGILCGACRENHSVIIGSSWCRDCSSHSSLTTFTFTVLFGFLGVVLLLSLGVLNLNVTEGPLNPIIFYMNVVRLNDSIFFGYGGNTVHHILRIFTAWMNLDFGIDTCYYHGMTTTAKTSLQFVFPFYLWCLCGLFIYLSRHSSLVSRIAGKQSVRLLATVILLSYAKILKTVIDLVWPLTLLRFENAQLHHEMVWKMNGRRYFQNSHKFLCIFATIIAICTLPYTVSLLFIQCLKKVSHYKVLSWVVKLKPFFDAYTGPYKDKYQFWTGFLLVVRFCLFIAIACNTTKGPVLNMTLVCGTVAILFLLSQVGVYKARLLSFLESLVYFNLILFSIVTVYVFQQRSTPHYYSNDKGVLIFVGSMFLLFCGVVAFNIGTIVTNTQCWGKLKIWVLERQWIWKKRTPIKSLVLQHSVSDTSSSSDDEMDPILENAPPVAHYDQLREPLVETN